MDLYVFPELHKTPDGALEAEFYAFKIPDSTFLVFQATVRTCRGPCEPVICNDKGRGHAHFPSWGRRRREAGNSTDTPLEEGDVSHEDPPATGDDFNSSETVVQAVVSTPSTTPLTTSTTSYPTHLRIELPLPSARTASDDIANEAVVDDAVLPEEEVHELFRVYMSRDEIPDSTSDSKGQSSSPSFPASPSSSSSSSSAARMIREELILPSSSQDRVCVSQSGYYALVTAITVLTTLVLSMGVAGTIVLKKSHMTKVIH